MCLHYDIDGGLSPILAFKATNANVVEQLAAQRAALEKEFQVRLQAMEALQQGAAAMQPAACKAAAPAPIPAPAHVAPLPAADVSLQPAKPAALPGPRLPLDSHPANVYAFMQKWGFKGVPPAPETEDHTQSTTPAPAAASLQPPTAAPKAAPTLAASEAPPAVTPAAAAASLQPDTAAPKAAPTLAASPPAVTPAAAAASLQPDTAAPKALSPAVTPAAPSAPAHVDPLLAAAAAAASLQPATAAPKADPALAGCEAPAPAHEAPSAPPAASLQPATAAPKAATPAPGVHHEAPLPPDIPGPKLQQQSLKEHPPGTPAPSPIPPASASQRFTVQVLARSPQGVHAVDMLMKPSTPFKQMMKRWCDHQTIAEDKVIFKYNDQVLQSSQCPQDYGWCAGNGTYTVHAMPCESEESGETDQLRQARLAGWGVVTPMRTVQPQDEKDKELMEKIWGPPIQPHGEIPNSQQPHSEVPNSQQPHGQVPNAQEQQTQDSQQAALTQAALDEHDKSTAAVPPAPAAPASAKAVPTATYSRRAAANLLGRIVANPKRLKELHPTLAQDLADGDRSTLIDKLCSCGNLASFNIF